MNDRFSPVFNQSDAIKMCDKLNATLPYSWTHINALREYNLIRKDIGTYLHSV